jgi:hypothetical protein
MGGAPGALGRASRTPRRGAPRRAGRFGGQIGGELGIARPAHEEAGNDGLVTLVEHGERLALAPGGATQELAIASIAHAHHTGLRDDSQVVTAATLVPRRRSSVERRLEAVSQRIDELRERRHRVQRAVLAPACHRRCRRSPRRTRCRPSDSAKAIRVVRRPGHLVRPGDGRNAARLRCRACALLSALSLPSGVCNVCRDGEGASTERFTRAAGWHPQR